jgi:hypothetical protein
VGLLFEVIGVLVWSTVTRLAAWRRRRRGDDDERLRPERPAPERSAPDRPAPDWSGPMSIADEAHAWLELQ